MAAHVDFPAVVDVLKVVTALGSAPVTFLLIAATVIWALVRRRPVDAAALAVGWALTWALAHLAKDLYGRPRPAGGYVDAIGLAYPSAHAAYAVGLVACAVVLVRAGSPLALRFAAVTVALVAVVVVALSRVVLRVHYLTDVLGGVALGTAVYALVGCVALVVAYVRDNPVPARV